MHSAGCKKRLTAKVAKKGREGRKNKQPDRSVSPARKKEAFLRDLRASFANFAVKSSVLSPL
ncbi:MAG: hypothetical protein DMG82_16300 [Acidobacteria bacterium]|nr:MAG: hypothetical protein DMG82_16300 [Acidobacteriota bacterium]